MAIKKSTKTEAPAKTSTAKTAVAKVSSAKTAVVKKTKAATAVVKATKPVTALATKAKKSAALATKPTASTELINQYRTHKEDTGSTAVQIAQLTGQITELQKHLKKHPGDNDSRRGLLIMVGKRRRLLNYLGRSDEQQYKQLIVDLKLRK